MANVTEKNKALKLRLKGRSISEISEKLSVPKSTVGVWCRNVRLGKEQIKKLRQEGLSDIKDVSKRDLFVLGIAMYLSEGATSECSEEVSFTNSDFRTILFMKKWFNEICGISNERFIVQIRINEFHKNKIGNAESYWSKIIGIPKNQFTKTILIKSKSKKIYSKDNIYFGTVRLKVRQGTQLRRKINGWVEGLLKLN